MQVSAAGSVGVTLETEDTDGTIFFVGESTHGMPFAMPELVSTVVSHSSFAVSETAHGVLPAMASHCEMTPVCLAL